MLATSRKALIEAGVRTAGTMMVDQDRIWSQYSNDKVDIGEKLAGVIRTLSVASPLTRKLRALLKQPSGGGSIFSILTRRLSIPSMNGSGGNARPMLRRCRGITSRLFLTKTIPGSF